MTYVALLRGINVGGNNKISMPDLIKSFQEHGYQNPLHYINTGNIIFETNKTAPNKLASEIEKLIAKDFNLQIPVVIRTAKEIKEVCTITPTNWLNDSKTQKTDVMFLWPEIDSAKILQDISQNPEVDNLIYIPGAIVWNLDREKFSKSKMNDLVGTKTYKLMTVRNINTVRKINFLITQRLTS
jgi:uncharacterized protein (DUF1697 family)